MARVIASEPARADAGLSPRLSAPVQHVLCILVVACAIKTPLDLPLYWNAGLLVLGFVALAVIQSLQPVFVWMLVLVGLGTLQGLLSDDPATSVPRLAQLFLLVLATSLVVRLNPDLLLKYVVLLVPVILVVTVVEFLWPEPFYPPRHILGYRIHRHAGLHGEPNYSAMLYGVVAVLLAQQRPRVLAVLPLAAAVPALSRGLVIALALWLTTLLFRRRRARLCIGLIVLLCLQPVLVLLFRLALDDHTLQTLSRLSTERLGIWLAYLDMGLSHPLGTGYFLGIGHMKEFAIYVLPNWPEMYAHSLFVQVFGEFGWLGYLLFVGFLFHVTAKVARGAPDQLPVLVFLLTGYSLVNGLSDWAFWVVIGWLLARSEGTQAEPARP